MAFVRILTLFKKTRDRKRWCDHPDEARTFAWIRCSVNSEFMPARDSSISRGCGDVSIYKESQMVSLEEGTPSRFMPPLRRRYRLCELRMEECSVLSFYSCRLPARGRPDLAFGDARAKLLCVHRGRTTLAGNLQHQEDSLLLSSPYLPVPPIDPAYPMKSRHH